MTEKGSNNNSEALSELLQHVISCVCLFGLHGTEITRAVTECHRHTQLGIQGIMAVIANTSSQGIWLGITVYCAYARICTARLTSAQLAN